MSGIGAGNNELVIFTAHAGNRLIYVLNWIFTERLQIPYRLVTDEAEIGDLPFFISYGKHFNNAISIPQSGLVTGEGINEHNITIGSWHKTPVLYYVEDDAHTIPFDMFSAIFFLLSRYEEYYDYAPDKHNRYPATQSILYKNGWLQRPIVDEWVSTLASLLHEQFNIKAKYPGFVFQPSYDIDIAYSYLHKGRSRSIGAFLKDVLMGDTKHALERIAVSGGKKKDPFDCYEWLRELHKNTKYTPLYFILASLQTTDFDKNIKPTKPKMRQLIQRLSSEGTVGMHPSYYSDKFPAYWNREKNILEEITDKSVTRSRQHYIKVLLPGTYDQLLINGIKDDYSMGYGTHVGFRAGTGATFHFYNLAEERTTDLRIHPFCFMDTTAFYEERLNVQAAFAVLQKMRESLERCNSQLITIFHNFSLGTSEEWEGWNDAYSKFLEK